MIGWTLLLRAMPATICAVAVTAALAACVTTASTEPPPAAFTDRAPLVSCGQIRAGGPGDPLESLYPQSAMNCLERGRGASGAEWSTVGLTTEGDPVTTYYRVVPDSPDVDIFLDRSRDMHWGGDGWTRLSCEVAVISGPSLRMCTSNI